MWRLRSSHRCGNETSSVLLSGGKEGRQNPDLCPKEGQKSRLESGLRSRQKSEGGGGADVWTCLVREKRKEKKRIHIRGRKNFSCRLGNGQGGITPPICLPGPGVPGILLRKPVIIKLTCPWRGEGEGSQVQQPQLGKPELEITHAREIKESMNSKAKKKKNTEVGS